MKPSKAEVAARQEAEALAKILRGRRERRGAIDFDFNEAQVVVEADGTPADVVLRTRSVGERMIEEFMPEDLLAIDRAFFWAIWLKARSGTSESYI